MKKWLEFYWRDIVLWSSVAMLIIFWCTHPTYYKYNDAWIVGNTIENVQKIYGDFDYVGKYVVGYYIYTEKYEDSKNGIKFYYYISFNRDGVVTWVWKDYQPDRT